MTRLAIIAAGERERAPDFSGTTQAGEPFGLADLIAGGPAALVLSRGFV